jgi:acyl-CoA reductase-like NAD-dependent aldehyde dehydrogenase
MDIKALRPAIDAFNAKGQLGQDPLAALYPQRRKGWSIFAKNLSDAEMEGLRRYIFCYERIPSKPDDKPVRLTNFVAGEWRAPKKGEHVTLKSLADRRVPLMEVPASTAADVEQAIAYAHDFWKSLAWGEEVVNYRKWVLKNLSRLLHYFYEECMTEIREQIPKTRLEADKDFWEAKRAVDHLEGTSEVGMRGELLPPMLPGHSYWRNPYLPAGVAAVITPMNFIYGISGIQIAGAYLSGCPMIYKGHPFAGLTNTTLIRMMLASGADPRTVQKIEGFGGGIADLATDPRVAVVSVTGSEETARKIQDKRGLGRLRFEGGGCNWSYVDDGFSPDDLKRIAVRLTYSKCGFGSHKCTTLHGVAASPATLAKLAPLIATEMEGWKAEDPRQATEDKVLSPLMVHKAATAASIVAAAKEAGCKVWREGGIQRGAWGDHAEVFKPALIQVKPDTRVKVDWDGKGTREIRLSTTEFFMPVLCAMELPDFDAFLRFCLVENSHDLATSIWTRDDQKLQRARSVIGGMLKENDGTDSALEWEEFGASGIGDSGNMGVGEIQATMAIYCRRQKGRHIVF